MWKDFFYYSKSERIAIIVLLLLIMIFVLVTIYVPNYLDEKKEQELPVSVEMEEAFLASIKEKEIHRKKQSSFGNKFRVKERKSAIREGEGKKMSVPKYSDKDTLRTYSYPKQEKFVAGTQVDANKADTVLLKKIPGIGSVISRSIVRYRERLGGFATLDQLKEVRFFKPELLKWFKLESAELRKIDINKATMSTLCKHPYLNYEQAKVIFRCRKKNGPIKSLSQLALYEEFTEKDLCRLSPYLSFQ